MLSIYGSTKLQPLVRRLRNWQRLRRRTKLGHVALRAPAPPQAVLILPDAKVARAGRSWSAAARAEPLQLDGAGG